MDIILLFQFFILSHKIFDFNTAKGIYIILFIKKDLAI